MPQLAFFPWIEIEGDVDAGGYSLKRFVRGTLPGLDSERQATLDAVLAPYRDLQDKPVRTACILAGAGRSLTDDLSGQDRAELFLFAELFTFAALAAREFFSLNYFNRDHLRLVIQAFADPQGGAVLETRRRDGSRSSWVTGNHYRVQVPAHVSSGGCLIKPDYALLEALLAARERKVWAGLHQGIVLFNEANTDASDMSPNTELVLTYAAMEQVLGITKSPERKQFAAKLAAMWCPTREVSESEWRPHAPDRPWKEESLRACWASDLKSCRGNLAHGHRAGLVPSQWTVRQHLLLTSFAIPRLVKQVLSKMYLYELADEDERDINALEALLNLPDVFAVLQPEDDEADVPDEDYAWRQVLRREADRQLYQVLENKL